MGTRLICFLCSLLVLSTAGSAWGDLVGWWTLDEGSGTKITDSSGKGNHGTIVNKPTWIAGVQGLALEFHGLGVSGGNADYITIPHSASLDITGKTSMALWIRPEADDPEGKATTTAPMAKAISTATPSWSYQVRYGWGSTKPYMAFTFNTSPRAWAYVNKNLTRNEWCHIACSYDGTTLKCYLNGEQTDSTAMGVITSSPTPTLIGTDGWGCDWIGAIDDVRIYNNALTADEIKAVMMGPAKLASHPSPTDGAVDVLVDTSVGWQAGIYAATHDVYLGKTFADVNTASRAKPAGLLVSQNQTATTYTPASVLGFGQTYYWRVDEANKAPDTTIYKGNVWSFTTETYGVPVTPVAATASSASFGAGPENTINGSGLTGDLHGNDGSTMWLTTGAPASWIQYQFDKVYKLYDLKVWNYNGTMEPYVGFGAKDVKIECSTDGTTWTTVPNVPQFARATGLAGYAANTTVSLGGVQAKYVKLTINANWGGMSLVTGLSEVRFSYVPVQARLPQPANAATGQSLTTTLSWRSGREAASHKVFFGTDQAAVTNGTASAKTVTARTFDPGTLAYGTTYYWRVDEVNTTTYPGDVWSFTTQEFTVVDDFESYDQDANRIYDAWIDGATDGKSGSFVGYNPTAAQLAAGATFAERTIIHGGKQSMPMDYNNVKGPYFSEVTRTFAPVQDWTGGGADTLVLYVQGSAPGFVAAADGTYTMGSTGTDIWNSADQFRFAYKSLSGNGTLVAKVLSVTNSAADVWGKAGVMIRESLAVGSKFAAVYATPGSGVRFQARATADAAATSDTAVITPEQTGLKAPVWVKVERIGNVFNGYYSLDGVKWTAMSWNPQTVTMTAGTVYIGLAITGHAATEVTTAQFSSVAATGNVTGSWLSQSIGVTQSSNDPGQLYVMVQDSAGKSKVVNYPDLTATTTTTWQQWRIPLSQFTAAGVKMTSVKQLVIGVGNRTSPTADGAGRMYFDDIAFGHPAK